MDPIDFNFVDDKEFDKESNDREVAPDFEFNPAGVTLRITGVDQTNQPADVQRRAPGDIDARASSEFQ